MAPLRAECAGPRTDAAGLCGTIWGALKIRIFCTLSEALVSDIVRDVTRRFRQVNDRLLLWSCHVNG